MAEDAPAPKKAPAKKTTAKAPGPATTLAKGGGPENPGADAAAAKAAAEKLRAKHRERAEYRADQREARAAQSHQQRQADRAQLRTPRNKGAGTPKKLVGWAWSGNRRVLTAQFLLCIVVLGLGTVTAPPGSKDDVHRAMVKGSALSLLFMLLALTSSGGKGAAKAATALGTLITAAYVFTSSDVHNLVAWMNGFFAKDGPAWKLAAAAEADVGAADTSAASDLGSGIDAVANQVGQDLAGSPAGQQQTNNGTNEGWIGPGGSYTSTTGFGY